ncbi:peptidyl-prolyl cis-trans isomerase [Polyangium aurulentum]|uniref:peptidyl-prolyl cis-trans isomerase n=1 Tax=Polyangium aurulentum TaxID=2567896 RepID=UPI0010AE1E44|nr:peptidyl-prolyl cis-trans isomerase [Polyangium aurulentum]UQA62134.1 peptidyl-prolyl cis-trans isomerase [Polyangium aurulentum]
MRSAPLLRGLFAATLALVAATAGISLGNAQAPAPEQSPTVAKVGARIITQAEVERRLASMPPFQLRYFGKTTEEIRKKFVEEAIVREALLAEGGEAEHLRDLPEVGERIRGVLRNALLAQIRAEASAQGPVTDEEVRAYYDKHQDKYHAPARIALWRILVASREEALEIIAQVKGDLSPKRWNEIARDKSLDKTNNMRGGNLGFVEPDGKTSDPNVKVDPALVQAAEKVKDSELVPEPVQEGSQWAVVWRRQSMKAVDRPLELEAPSIRQVLMHERTEQRVKDLVAELRKKHLGELHPELVELLAINSSGDVAPVRRPGTVPSARRPAAGSPAPTQAPGDLR